MRERVENLHWGSCERSRHLLSHAWRIGQSSNAAIVLQPHPNDIRRALYRLAELIAELIMAA